MDNNKHVPQPTLDDEEKVVQEIINMPREIRIIPSAFQAYFFYRRRHFKALSFFVHAGENFSMDLAKIRFRMWVEDRLPA